VGGDYPVSATLMSEYANRRDHGKLITLVFSTQALGLIVGPLVAILLIISGVSTDLTWRIMLALGAVPALATFSLRRQITESPRFALSQGNFTEVARAIAQATQQTQQNASSTDKVQARPTPPKNAELQIPREILQHPSWQQILSTRHSLIWIIETAGCWFLLDVAYYGVWSQRHYLHISRRDFSCISSRHGPRHLSGSRQTGSIHRCLCLPYKENKPI
jgi:MFS transporter, PHS family, inorganic phosphate transporter